MSDAQAGPTPLPATPTVLLDPLPNILTCGSLNLLAGASGIGKTALIAWLMRQFRDGAPIFGHPTQPPPAIGYLTADRPWEHTKHWFSAVGFPEVRQYSIIDDATLKLPNQRLKHLRVDFFKSCVAKLQLPPGSLLVVDPIALFLGGNLLDYDTVAFACIEIHRWLQQPPQMYCTLGLAHSAKQRAEKNDRYLRLQDRISGSMALLGYTETQMYLAAPEETGDKEGAYTFLWNPHTAPAEVFQFHKGTNGLFLTEGVSTQGSTGDPLSRPLSPFELEVYAQFPYGPESVVSTHQFVALYSADGGEAKRKAVQRALATLEARGLIVKLRRGVWKRAE